MVTRVFAVVLLLATVGLVLYWYGTGWTDHDAGPFRFSAPRDLRVIPVEGEDSLAGEFTCSLFYIHSDYGIHGMDYKVPDADMTRVPATIDDREATIMTFPRQGKFVTAVSFEKVESSGMGPVKLNLWVESKDLSTKGAALRLVHSIRFK